MLFTQGVHITKGVIQWGPAICSWKMQIIITRESFVEYFLYQVYSSQVPLIKRYKISPWETVCGLKWSTGKCVSERKIVWENAVWCNLGGKNFTKVIN